MAKVLVLVCFAYDATIGMHMESLEESAALDLDTTAVHMFADHSMDEPQRLRSADDDVEIKDGTEVQATFLEEGGEGMHVERKDLYNGCDWKTNIGGFLNFCKWRKRCADNQGITDFGIYDGVPASCPPEYGCRELRRLPHPRLGRLHRLRVR